MGSEIVCGRTINPRRQGASRLRWSKRCKTRRRNATARGEWGLSESRGPHAQFDWTLTTQDAARLAERTNSQKPSARSLNLVRPKLEPHVAGPSGSPASDPSLSVAIRTCSPSPQRARGQYSGVRMRASGIGRSTLVCASPRATALPSSVKPQKALRRIFAALRRGSATRAVGEESHRPQARCEARMLE